MRTRLKDKHDLTVGLGTLWAVLGALGLTYTKTALATEQERPDLKAAREAWFEGQVKKEAIVVAFGQHTLPLLEDWLYARQATMPHLTPSLLCFRL